MGSRFWVADHFETSSLNDPKMALKTIRSKVLHTINPKSQISISFLLYGQLFLSYGSFWEVHWMTHRGQRYPHICATGTPPPPPKCISLRFALQTFRVTENFEKSAPNDTKMTLNTKRSKVTHIQVPDFTVLLYGQPFLSCRPFWVHSMTPKWPWTLQGQTYCYGMMVIMVCQ